MHSIKLYFKYVTLLFKSQLQYRVSFILLSLGQLLVPLTVFAGVYMLFQKFGQLKGWSFYEVALCFALIHITFAITECFVRGFDMFSSLIIRGDFDRIMVRPADTIVQVLGSNFEFTRVGRLLQALGIFIWVLLKIPVEWNLLKIITLSLMILSGIIIFSGIFIIFATMCFWTVQGLEVASIFTDGGREMGQYPLNIYKKWVTRFFTFVIPFGCVNYFPLLFILDRMDPGIPSMVYAFSPLYGILFIIPCILLWNKGVQHYTSTGS